MKDLIESIRNEIIYFISKVKFIIFFLFNILCSIIALYSLWEKKSI